MIPVIPDATHKRRHQEVPEELSRSESGSDYEIDDFVVPDDQIETYEDYQPENDHAVTARIDHNEIVKKMRMGKLDIREGKLSRKRGKPPKLSIEWKTDVFYRLGKKASESGKCNIVGRHNEVAQIMRYLAQPCGGMRPLLTGATGIGKKAIVRKLAFELENKNCPPQLLGRSVFIIDGAKLAGLRVSSEGRSTLGEYFRHEMEETLRSHFKPVIFFRDIDKILEVEGVKDYFKCLLKSDLTAVASFSGDISEEESVKHLKDLAPLNFFPMEVKELTAEEAADVVSHQLKKHPLPDSILLSPEAQQAAVFLSEEYIKDRKFPLKTLQLIHETANDVWQRYVQPKQKAKPKSKIKVQINPESVAKVMSSKTGIPSEYLVSSGFQRLQLLEKRLNEQIVGQEKAIATVCECINTDKMGFNVDSDKPRGVFLLVGSTGVGKTELARCLAVEMFFDKSRMIRFDMSEFSESHTISRLIGAPPGYVGFESGGRLCEALRRQPHSIVLLDEFEKAHEEVRQVFLQVMDEGRLTDGKGNTVDCSKAIFLMTSNLGAQELLALVDQKQHLDAATVYKCIEQLLLEELTPEFCNRLTAIVPFASLDKKDIPRVIEAQLKQLQIKYADRKQIQLSWDKTVIQTLAKFDFNPKLGMRTIAKEVKVQVARALSNAQFKSKEILRGKIELTIEKSELIASAK